MDTPTAAIGVLEPTKGTSLIWGKLLSLAESQYVRVEVRAGRWMRLATGKCRECLAILQYRAGNPKPFVLALEPSEAVHVLDGVAAWVDRIRMGTVAECFESSAYPQHTVQGS